MQSDDDLAGDLMRGANAIAEFLGPEFTARSVYHLHEKRAIPTFTLPSSNTLYGRKSELRRTFSAAA
jgi:hypothetical protein